jgi:hypothetical protein
MAEDLPQILTFEKEKHEQEKHAGKGGEWKKIRKGKYANHPKSQ